MEVFGYLIAGALAWLIWHLFKKRNEDEVSFDIVPAPPLATPPGINPRQRRRRLSGGFYPMGYAGPYLDGEDLLDELLWQAELYLFTNS